MWAGAYYAETHDVRLEDGILAWVETCKKPDLKPSAYDRLGLPSRQKTV